MFETEANAPRMLGPCCGTTNTDPNYTSEWIRAMWIEILHIKPIPTNSITLNILLLFCCIYLPTKQRSSTSTHLAQVCIDWFLTACVWFCKPKFFIRWGSTYSLSNLSQLSLATCSVGYNTTIPCFPLRFINHMDLIVTWLCKGEDNFRANTAVSVKS